MSGETRPRGRLISIQIEQHEEGILVATSKELPGLLAVAKDEDELALDLPALIESMYKARFGSDIKAFVLDDAPCSPMPHLEKWAAIPVAA